jgi:hypothetical protein
MLINLSNHPKVNWSEKQSSAALRKYKSVFDLPFPYIYPNANSNQVKSKAEFYLKKILQLLKNSPDKNNAVHLMGEFTFVYHLAAMLKRNKIHVVVSTTDRIVEEKNRKKIVTFNFVRFREY